MIAGAKTRVRALLGLYTQHVCRDEYERQEFTKFNERPVEFAFVFSHIARLAPKTVLDVGTGKTSLPHMVRVCGPLVTAVDNVRDYWPAGMVNRHFHVIDDDIRQSRLTQRFDLITCVSVLEHIEPADEAVRSMLGLLNPGGHLILTCPYTEGRYVRNVYELPESSYGKEASYITQSFSRADVNRWLEQGAATLVDQEFWRYWTGSHWTLGSQVIPPQRVTAESLHQHTCLLFRKG
jgi:2-polyprenyl-3-methyl-5-hydroxy-6-metoxy-1,4-benzoquinol methylase